MIKQIIAMLNQRIYDWEEVLSTNRGHTNKTLSPKRRKEIIRAMEDLKRQYYVMQSIERASAAVPVGGQLQMF
ncbi:MAG: hypothetical protein WCT12_19860 [Verrucomicrobiota bacterium]